jgi:hypothetical protein
LFKKTQNSKVKWEFFNSILAIAKGPLTVFFILRYLNIYEQGVWYSFLSLGALSVFAEMGFTRIISVLASHEYANLRLKNGFIIGSYKARKKLHTLINYSFFLYSYVILFFILLMLLTGYYFFEDDTYFYEWAFYVFFSAALLLLSLVQSIFIGFNEVILINKHKILATISSTLVMWTFLALGFSLWTLIFSLLSYLIVSIYLLFNSRRGLILQYIRKRINGTGSWFYSTYKLQLKYAVSFISGYIGGHLFVPYIYKVISVNAAGKFGLTFALSSALLVVSSVWLNANAPSISIMISKGKVNYTRLMFKKYIFNGVITYVSFGIFFIFILSMLNEIDLYGDRFLSEIDLFLLLLAKLATLLIGFLGVYTRLYKVELLYTVSFISIILNLFLLTVILPEFGLTATLFGSMIVEWFFLLPYSYHLTKSHLFIKSSPKL